MLLRRSVILWLALIVTVLAWQPAWAAIKPKVAVEGAAVAINRRLAVRFVAGNGSLSAEARAQITADRLRALIESGVDPASLSYDGNKNQARIMAGESLICIATSADAKAQSSTPVALARVWAGNIRYLLSMPPLALEPSRVLVPLGENRRVEIVGSAYGPIYARSANPEIATVTAGTDGWYILVLGRCMGDTTIEVSVEGERASVSVSVRKYAGRVPELCVVEVTGNPCPASVVSYAAEHAPAGSALAEPGAVVRIEKIEPVKQALQPGASCRTTARVTITGANYIPYSGQATVEVRNIQMPRDQVVQLFYSNSPERLLKYETLFAGRIELESPTRVLYHHQNMMGKRVRLIVEVLNPSSSPAKLRIYRGVARPLVDTVAVGHIAGSAFLRNHESNVSVIENVPPESRLVLVSDMLDHMKTASGILQLRQMSGENLFVRINAAEPYVDNVVAGQIAPTSSTVVLRMSDHIYPSPVKNLETSYLIGGRWAFIPIGRHALEDSAAQKKLYGNYGVTYNINVRLQNPTSQTKKVSVLFDPTAGIASGVFVIDGKFVLARNAQPPSEVPLAGYSLAPGEVRDLRIMTVPLAGSNYPANLVVRS